MIAGRPYERVRPSGVEWLGDVPEGWEVRSLGSLTRARSEKGRTDLPLLSVARERGVFVRSLTGEDGNHNVIPDDLAPYKVALAGSLVINKMKAWQGSMGIAPCDGVVSPAYYVYDLAFENRRYAERLLRSKPYVARFAAASDGVRIGQWDLSIAGMKAIATVVPPPDEQAAIVRFLDHAVGRLDRAIVAKRRVVRLLEEQRRAIVHRAVTRGLDPHSPMRDSGVPWLGEVPAGWEVLPLKRVAKITPGFAFASADFVAGGGGSHRLLRGINVSVGKVRWDTVVGWNRHPNDRLDDFELAVGDIVLGMDRPFISNGVRAAIITDKDLPALLLQRVCRIRGGPLIRTSYAHSVVSGRMFVDYVEPLFSGISVPHMSGDQIGNFFVPLPPINDQDAIIASVERETAALRTAEDRIEREVTLLEEYRTALVSEVVTGKRDVREAAARLPDAPPPVALDGGDDGDPLDFEVGEDDLDEQSMEDALA